ncbi:MAG TPA: LUD domain-containing protein [Chryseosolibacter sp.]|nr:LUD domain-containing protein [Chryseosolibacter sp.]
MSSRDKILSEVRKNQPPNVPLPDLTKFKGLEQDNVQKYIDTFTGIGGNCFVVENVASMKALIGEQFDTDKRIVTTLDEFADVFERYFPDADPHTFENVELAVIQAHLAVAENGAVWLTDPVMGQRILPFICQHLAVWVDARTIVATMHEAYQKIGLGDYGFGVFIGGPSKTADIEQSLVLGAHGPISMTVFIQRN